MAAPVEPSAKCMSAWTCSPKSCMKPSAPSRSASRIRPFHQRTAAGSVKSIWAPLALKLEMNVYGAPLLVVAT